MGHVAHRDGTRAILQTAGLSLLFGTFLGDFVGGTAVVTAAKSMIQLSYSRRVETAADTFGVGVMQRAGGDARALGVLLTRLQGDQRPRMRLWLDHPQVQDRVRNIDALAPAAAATAPLLDADQWAALQHICKDF
jgi:predicted Zn-dependent protease